MTYNHSAWGAGATGIHMLISAPDWMFSSDGSSLLKVDFDGNVLTDTDVFRRSRAAALIIHAGLA